MKADRRMFLIRSTGVDDNNRLGKLIRARRLAKDLTQEQLAMLFGINKNAVGAWEQGRNTPKVEDIPTLCEALDISLYEFFGLATPFEGTREGRVFLEKISELNDYNRLLISRMADTMIDTQEEDRRRSIAQKMCRIFHNAQKTAAGYGNPLTDRRCGSYVYLYGNDMIWQADEIITVTGDSMEPTYSDGDQLLVQYTEQIKPGQIGIFVADGEGLVKEYRPDGLHSHNAKYPVRHFTDDDNVRCIGKLLGKLEKGQLASKEDIEIYKDVERCQRV